MGRFEDSGMMVDEEAFRQIVRTHGPTLARYVRHRIANPSDAEDVLQEIFVAIWLGFKNLRNPESLYGWLMHVAQNRCRDYFRAQQRRDLPLEEEMLQAHANRFGLHCYRQTQILTDVIDALETAPEEVREAARRFYLDGLSIAEIATESQSPLGTVKRQLFQARHAARRSLGIPHRISQTHEEKTIMTTQIPENPTQFPETRPHIRITELDEAPFSIDCRELRSWSIIPIVGEQSAYADYALPGWKLIEVSSMQALRVGQVHDVEGVEIEVRVWNPETRWQRPGTVYARLTEDKAEFLAVHLPQKDLTQIETFLDEWFSWNWGTLDRTILDSGLVKRQPDGSFLLSETVSNQNNSGLAAGVVWLEINGRAFTCLRVIDGDISKSDSYLTESFLTQEGRTVLVRRFCLPRFAEVAQFPVILDESIQRVINGVTFVHWYDSVMEIALSDR